MAETAKHSAGSVKGPSADARAIGPLSSSREGSTKSIATKVQLVVQTAFLGDLLLTIPAIRHIRAKYPEQKIWLVCRAGLGAVLVQLGVVDQVFEIHKGDGKSYRKILGQMSGAPIERVYCLHRSVRSALFTWQVRAAIKVGFRFWWNALVFDRRVKYNKELPEALRLMELVGHDDTDLVKKLREYQSHYSVTELGPVPEWASMQLLQPANQGPRRVALFPGSVWATKQWTLAGFIELARYFIDQGEEVWLLGGKGEETLAEQILQQVPECHNKVAKTSLTETLELLRSCSLVVSNDSAGQHLAATVGVPTVGIFGPTVLALGFRPWNPHSRVVETAQLSCRPCGKHGHRVCPLGTHECMKSISARQVIAAALSLRNPSR